jgi:hypothetical protein
MPDNRYWNQTSVFKFRVFRDFRERLKALFNCSRKTRKMQMLLHSLLLPAKFNQRINNRPDLLYWNILRCIDLKDFHS